MPRIRSSDITAVAGSTALLLVVAVAGGCSSPLLRSVPATELERRGRHHLIEGLVVPEVRGVEGCGAQALAAVLAFVDPGLDATALAEALPWHESGATPVDLLLAARDRGAEARIASGDWDGLVELVDADQPVLVMINAGFEVRTITARIPSSPVMHWAVTSGVATDGSEVLLGAPDDRHHPVRREEFLRRWSPSAHCMIVVTGGSDPGAGQRGD
jgi:ABC-type bacteriocin/lantibiotic exporter with double-glycine peptidase domain